MQDQDFLRYVRSRAAIFVARLILKREANVFPHSFARFTAPSGIRRASQHEDGLRTLETPGKKEEEKNQLNWQRPTAYCHNGSGLIMRERH